MSNGRTVTLLTTMLGIVRVYASNLAEGQKCWDVHLRLGADQYSFGLDRDSNISTDTRADMASHDKIPLLIMLYETVALHPNTPQELQEILERSRERFYAQLGFKPVTWGHPGAGRAEVLADLVRFCTRAGELNVAPIVGGFIVSVDFGTMGVLQRSYVETERHGYQGIYVEEIMVKERSHPFDRRFYPGAQWGTTEPEILAHTVINFATDAMKQLTQLPTRYQES